MSLPSKPSRRLAPGLPLLIAVASLVITACALFPPADPPPFKHRHQVLVATAGGELVRVNAGDPTRVLHRVPLQGLQPGETLVGIDFRVARGVLFALSSRGRLMTVDVASGRLSPVGDTPLPLEGRRFGFDFNPTVDRIRIVSDTGQNLRAHPDTGALVSRDAGLAGAQPFAATAAAYTYNKTSDRLTTNYAIDSGAGLLLRQGSLEGAQPVVSPNTGQLAVVGPLGTGPLDDASFDIADVDNAALAALTARGHTRLYEVELASGRARLLGTLPGGSAIRGLAIEP